MPAHLLHALQREQRTPTPEVTAALAACTPLPVDVTSEATVAAAETPETHALPGHLAALREFHHNFPSGTEEPLCFGC